MAKQKSPALGKGLEALLGNIEQNPVVRHKMTSEVNAEIANISLKDIEPNPDQPRKEFNQQAMEELAQSIKEQGVIVPITVNKHGDKYRIIAGERRYRASKMAGLEQIPVYIRIVTDQSAMQMALIENIQREDLNAIEIALSLKALLEQSGLTQEELGNKIGKSRSAIANYVRLLNLPAEVQLSIRNDEISMGHARAIINIDNEKDQIFILRKIIKDNLSVRQVEALVKHYKSPQNETKPKEERPLPEMHSTFQKSLSLHLDTQIQIKRSKRGKGTITISFRNDKEFERIVELLNTKQ
ncbi:MAG: ParB/RepB/Spo0J family partition protein [Bacteroidales bacterium]|nr:ParB/RepB/Spo0J family partition protein [Bacteroidales bacterium]